MSQVNIGLTDNERSSSRILKPPGGGHSDIFGINSTEPVKQASSKKYQKSSIIFDDENDNENKNSTNQQRKVTPPIPGHAPVDTTEASPPATNIVGSEIVDNGSVNQNQNGDHQDKQQQPTAKPKQRVPPGGYSSILW